SPAAAKSAGGAIDGSVLSTPSSSTISKGQRGLNKPKCIKCGNVARSRCPYQSCKNCCAKAQNPCHIHVLKGSSSLPDKPPSSSSLFDQQSTDLSHSGNSYRLRQLSSNFAQFSNLQTPLRSRKPLTKKEAQVINEWRFIKLKEFKDGKIEAESEAFDRYMRNVSLLEEVFSTHSVEDDGRQNDSSGRDGENAETPIDASSSLKLRSDAARSANFRKRIKDIVDGGLSKLGKELLLVVDTVDDLSETEIGRRLAKKVKSSSEGEEKEAALSDVVDKLNKARNEDDLKECREMASEILKRKPNIESDHASYSPRKRLTTSYIDQESLCKLDAQFCSLEEIEDL
ncbi:hypothetical protein M569_00534, partial [Genlisea aurea]